MSAPHLRGIADPVGFAHTRARMEAVAERIERGEAGAVLGMLREGLEIPAERPWRVAIAPHDDYAYASFMYPLALANVRAKTVVIVGVAHKARALGLENRVVFDSFTHWRGPYGDIAVSTLRDALVAALDPALGIVHDEMQGVEHSVEAKLPYLQRANREVEIVSILVPAMPHARMEEIAAPLALVIAAEAKARGWEWGGDFAIVISTDAVHYGDEGWGGRDFALYGADERGYWRAMAHDRSIMKDCFEGEPSPARSRLFASHTVREDDWREYKWTWCGRYSVPFGMLLAWHLQQAMHAPPLEGRVLGYATSIDTPRIPVDDLDGMGVTAPASLRHWVGYAAVGYL